MFFLGTHFQQSISHLQGPILIMVISFRNKLEVVQYNAALAITGAIRGTSRIKVYQELGRKITKIS